MPNDTPSLRLWMGPKIGESYNTVIASSICRNRAPKETCYVTLHLIMGAQENTLCNFAPDYVIMGAKLLLFFVTQLFLPNFFVPMM